MFIDSLVYLFQNYWFILLLAAFIGFIAGWKSCTATS